jgi:hypothetical protein
MSLKYRKLTRETGQQNWTGFVGGVVDSLTQASRQGEFKLDLRCTRF